jgi:hypothetical protein
LISCNANQDHQQTDDTYKLIETSEKAFALDSLTSALNSQIQVSPSFCEDNCTELLCLLNFQTNELLYYDYNTSAIIKRIKLSVEGANGVGNVTGFIQHNNDSLFLYQHQNAQLALLNKDDKVVKRYKLASKQNYKMPHLAEYYQGFLKKDTVFLNSWGAYDFYDAKAKKENNLMVGVNLKDTSAKYYLGYPKLYQSAIWGVQLHFMFNAYNVSSQEELFSFVIDDSITVRNRNGLFKRYFAGSKFALNKINPISTKSKLSQLPAIEKEVENQVTQTTYGPIWTDPYSGFSYRMVNKALSKKEYESNNPKRNLRQNFSVVILDKAYNKVGELDNVSYDYANFKVFFTKKGLHILKSGFTKEDKMVFGIFELKKI